MSVVASAARARRGGAAPARDDGRARLRVRFALRACCTACLELGLAVMRGERERPRVHMAYWLLAALYAFAMLGNAVAAGEGMLQDVALCIPLVTAAVPLGVGVAAGAATEAAATRLSEHVVPSEEAVAASVEAWCDVFMRDFQEQHCVDHHWSNERRNFFCKFTSKFPIAFSRQERPRDRSSPRRPRNRVV